MMTNPKPVTPPIALNKPEVIYHMTNGELSDAITRTHGQLMVTTDSSDYCRMLAKHMNALLEIEAGRAAAWRLNAD